MSSRQSVIINYRTPDLLRQAVESFRHHYPAERLELVDNGSSDNSVDVMNELASRHPDSTQITVHPENLYHGPAMHRSLLDANVDYVFVLDSDTITRERGFLERMSAVLDEQDNVYAVGQVARVDRRGFAADNKSARNHAIQLGSSGASESADTIPVPVSAHMLIRREMYMQLPPFEHHGLPVLANCRAAKERGWRVAEFPIQDYVEHLGRGTAERFGYGLGWKSRLDYLLHRLGL